MRPFVALLPLMWLIAGSSLAADAPPMGPKISLNLQVLVPVDAEGRAGEARIGDELPEEASALVRERLAALRFEPALRDGTPVGSELSLSVPFTAQNIDGQVRYTVGQPRAAPFVRQSPRYPVDAIREGAAAALMVRVELSPDAGPDRMKAEVVASEFAPRRASRHKRQFEAAVLDAFAGCCRLVETIDGQPLGWSGYVPFSYSSTFSRDRVDLEAFKAAHAGEARDLPEGWRRAVLGAGSDDQAAGRATP